MIARQTPRATAEAFWALLSLISFVHNGINSAITHKSGIRNPMPKSIQPTEQRHVPSSYRIWTPYPVATYKARGVFQHKVKMDSVKRVFQWWNAFPRDNLTVVSMPNESSHSETVTKMRFILSIQCRCSHVLPYFAGSYLAKPVLTYTHLCSIFLQRWMRLWLQQSRNCSAHKCHLAIKRCFIAKRTLPFCWVPIQKDWCHI